MTEEEVETLLAGHEDANGCINYEGEHKQRTKCVTYTIHCEFWHLILGNVRMTSQL